MEASPAVLTRDFTFPAAYGMRLLDRIPRRRDVEVLAYPHASPVARQRELAAGPIVELDPPGRPPWIAVFDHEGEPSPAALDGALIGMPGGLTLCVVRGGEGQLVRADDPSAAAEVALSPITAALAAPDVGWMLFAGFGEVVAYDAAGVAWTSPRLALDDLELLRVEGPTLHARGFFGASRRPLEPFAVDLLTGEASGRPWAPD